MVKIPDYVPAKNPEKHLLLFILFKHDLLNISVRRWEHNLY